MIRRNAFVQHHSKSILGALSGLDRARFRGTLRFIANVDGMGIWLRKMGVLLKQFGEFANSVTERIKQASVGVAEAAGRPVQYIAGSTVRKEDVARAIAEREGISEGLVCVLTCVEPCQSVHIRRNRQAKKLELVSRLRKCLHVYHYSIDPTFGLMHARLQTWLPLTIKICINGREWLARQMDRAGMGYRRRENCFVQVEDAGAAQRLFDSQLRTKWPRTLNAILRRVSPAHERLFATEPLDYYWSADEIEWATDIMFRSPQDLARLYPRLITHAMRALGSRDILRFLGQKVPTTGVVHGNFAGEVVSDLRERPEGMRIKHRVKSNSIKMYDKQGSVLRVETTINNARDLRVFRGVEGQPNSPVTWRQARKGVADLHRHAEICQRANDRYLTALASAETGETLAELSRRLCSPVVFKGRRARALNPLAADDAALLEAISGGEFTVNGFRNRHLRRLLYAGPPCDDRQAKSRSAAVSRKIRLLRAHGLVGKVTKTHRYLVTPAGRKAITALLAARAADTAKLLRAA